MAFEAGVRVLVGPPSQLTIGSVNQGPANAEVIQVGEGVYRLNLTIPNPSADLVLAAQKAQAAAESVVARAGAGEFKGAEGPPGPVSPLAIGSVTVGATASATITGVVGRQVLNLVLPPNAGGPAITADPNSPGDYVF